MLFPALAFVLSAIAPVTPITVLAPFMLPPTPYAAGHRGVDLRADPGQEVTSPVTGTVVFAGMVVDRPVLTISDGRGRYSMEPVLTELPVGSFVTRGVPVGRVALGGHCSLRCVHFGLRVEGRYRNPLARHARLLPLR